MTLTKLDLVEELSKSLNIHKKHATDIVESFFDEIKNTLETGEEVKISGFGNFYIRDKKERPGRNPKTGEVVTITPRRVVKFRCGLKLRSRVHQEKVK